MKNAPKIAQNLDLAQARRVHTIYSGEQTDNIIITPDSDYVCSYCVLIVNVNDVWVGFLFRNETTEK